MFKAMVYITLFFSTLIIQLASSAESFSLENDSDYDVEDRPIDRNSSVLYLLYTPNNPNKPCYIEPKSSTFDKCDFNSSYDTKIVVHGFKIKLRPGNLFEIIKDTLLEYDKYNVIIVNWTKFNHQPYKKAMYHAYLVGGDLAIMINFIISHTGVSANSFHIIGHSLGAHIGGVAGKNVPNLGRITGLDAAGPGYMADIKFDRLTSTDAELVDAIHSSNAEDGYGFGTHYPLARINFYPNGGQEQPMCQMGKNYSDGDGVQHKIQTHADQSGCVHDASIHYFISSIFNCEYISTQCSEYSTYEMGFCNSSDRPRDRMGFHCESVSGLQDHSMFYLDTSGNYPFC